MDQLNALMSLFIPVVGIVFGLVEFAKKVFGLDGSIVTVMSFVIGSIVGGAVFAASLYPQAQVWVYGVLFIFAAGLVASGFYKFSATFR